MAARRCGLCGISYPAIAQFNTCPIHKEPTTWAANVEPDEDWQANFERAEKAAARASENIDRPFPIAHGVTAVEEGAQLFVNQSELFRAGVRLSRMQPDQEYLLELDDGWIYEVLGWHESGRRWWVSRVIEAAPDTGEGAWTANTNNSLPVGAE